MAAVRKLESNVAYSRCVWRGRVWQRPRVQSDRAHPHRCSVSAAAKTAPGFDAPTSHPDETRAPPAATRSRRPAISPRNRILGSGELGHPLGFLDRISGEDE
jgi:hypothetical protein